MKKFLFVFLLILLLSAAALAVFVATFDLNRYKPAIISQIETAVGNPVRIERLSLGYHGGISLEAAGLRVYSGGKTEGEPAMAAERVSAVLQLTQLLQRKIAIGSVIISRPRLHLLRSGDGAVHVMGLSAAKGKPPASSPGAALAAFPVLIRTVRIEDGWLRFTDSASAAPYEVQIRRLDITADDVSPGKPIEVDMRLALFAERQNVSLTGRFRPAAGNGLGVLENVRLKVNLSGFDSAELGRAFPGLGNLMIQGEALADLDRMTFGTGGVRDLAASVQLKDGRVVLPKPNHSIDRIGAVLMIQKDQVDIKHVFADWAGGKVDASGSVEQLTSLPLLKLRGTLTGLPLESFQSGTEKGGPQLRGILDGSFGLASSGLAWPQISGLLSGEVAAEVKEPVIVNFNLVREVLGRLALIPGLMGQLEKRLPENYLEKLNQKDTVLEPVHLDGKIGGRRVLFDRVLLVSDTFVLTGKISASFDGFVLGNAVLRLDPDLSAAFIRSVEELQYLTDREGRLEIPLEIQSDGAHLAIMPDLQYAASKLALAKAQETVGKWLEKKVGAKTGQEQATTGGETSSQKDLVGSLIGGLLKNQS